MRRKEEEVRQLVPRREEALEEESEVNPLGTVYLHNKNKLQN